MIHRQGKVLLSGFVLMLLLSGCGSSVQEGDIVDKIYTYEKEGFGGAFSIMINNDSTFSYYEGMLSSYIGLGNWTLEGDVLCLTVSEGSANYFKVDGNDLIFQSEDSSNFLYVTVANGERFTGAPADFSEK